MGDVIFYDSHMVFDEMIVRISVKNTLIHFYANCGKIKAAQKVFDEMTERSLYTWNSMLAGYCSNGCWEEMTERSLYTWNIAWVTLLMICYNIVFMSALLLLLVALDTQNGLLLFVSMVAIFVLFIFVHVYITALWHLASVVSVLEPVYGLAVMRKSYELLKGKTQMAFAFVFGYIMLCGMINGIFGGLVVHGGVRFGVFMRIRVGGFLVGVLVIVNLVGLLVQSMFYYVCKSYHNQGIDKKVLS